VQDKTGCPRPPDDPASDKERHLRIALALLLTLFAGLGSASDVGVSDAAKAEVAKLSPMVGRWKGSGWMDIPKAGRQRFDSEETVEPRLGGAALLIEGLHRDLQTKGIVHHALGLLSYDLGEKRYRMSTALANGRGGRFPATLEGKKFIWDIEAPGVPKRRFTISFDNPDKWVETGEYTLDGTKWTRFFEMDLDRVK